MSTATVFVKSPHLKLYDGQELELGQIFTMRSQRNDQRLIGYDYVEEVPENCTPDQCIGCGKEFVDTSYRQSHQIRVPHEAVTVDGPNLKRRRRKDGVDLDPDRSPDWDLEPEGSPEPPKLTPETAIAGERGLRSTRGERRNGRRASEVIRLGER